MPDAHDLGAVFGADLEDREHEVLLAQGRCALDAQLFGHGDELGGGFFLEVFEMHGVVLRTKCGETALIKKRGMRQDAASADERFIGEGSELADLAVASRRYVCAVRQVNALGARNREAQKGLTMTSTTISATAMPGISFMIRSVRFSSGRLPAASVLP